MCSSLKLEGKQYYTYINGTIPRENIVNGKSDYVWSGFARTDGSSNGQKTLNEQWPIGSWRPAFINIESFSEKHKATGRYTVFRKRRIGCIVNDETKELKILTRPARTEFEQSVHHRMPSCIPGDWDIKKYIAALRLLDGLTE